MTGYTPPTADGFYTPIPGVIAATDSSGNLIAAFEGIAGATSWPQFTNSSVGAVLLQCKGSAASCIFVMTAQGPNGMVQISPTDPAAKGLVIKGAASQTGNLFELQNNSNTILLKGDANGNLISGGKNVVVGTAALATNATSGFLYIPTTAGAPTGTPVTNTGTAPMVLDTTNAKLCVYRGAAWHCVAGF